jgi:hypothetical protein
VIETASLKIGRPVWWLMLVVAVGLTIYTTHKLYRMALIRGIIGSVPVQRGFVADKTRSSGPRGETCMLTWSDPAREARRHVQADCDYWERRRIGDPIDLVRVGGNDYLREGDVYASNGNFAFDFVLITLELASVIYCARRLRRHTDS